MMDEKHDKTPSVMVKGNDCFVQRRAADGKQSAVSRLFACTAASILRGLVTLSPLPLLLRDNNVSGF